MSEFLVDQLQGSRRMLMEAELGPVQGNRFQPTGFPHLGAAVYETPDGVRRVLVESAQSVANRLEQAIIGPDNELLSDFEGLSYIRVRLTEESDSTTNSLIEPHRINSPWIITNKEFCDDFVSEAEYDPKKPLNWKKIAHTLFKYDINSLLHGVFLANLAGGRIKAPRMLTGFIEAENAREAVSGGAKMNPLDPTGTVRAKTHKENVYGNVPFQRVEYVAERIIVYFNFDLALLWGLDLGKEAEELLLALGVYKVQAFLASGLRLRSACALQVQSALECKEPADFVIPEIAKVRERVRIMIKACRNRFPSPSVTELETAAAIVKSSEKSQTAETEEEMGAEEGE